MSVTRGPGRPRSEKSRRAVLSAALELTLERGYAALTIEGIAARAGVGKQTVYRWWGSRAEVLLEAFAHDVGSVRVPSDHGSYAEDLRALLCLWETVLCGSGRAEILRGLVAEAQLDAAFRERFRRVFVARRREELAELAERARRRGEPSPRLDPALSVELALAALLYRGLLAERALDRELVEQLVAVLASADRLGPRPLTLHARTVARRLPLSWRSGSGAGSGSGPPAGAGSGSGPSLGAIP